MKSRTKTIKESKSRAAVTPRQATPAATNDNISSEVLSNLSTVINVSFNIKHMYIIYM